MPQPIQVSGEHVDMSPRFFFSQAVAGSPATNEEHIICTLTLANDLAVVKGVLLEGWFSFTVGTSGVTATTKIRQTNAAGATIATSGAQTVVATNVLTVGIQGIDTAPASSAQVYVMTLTIGSGAAGSTVSAAVLQAIVL